MHGLFVMARPQLTIIRLEVFPGKPLAPVIREWIDRWAEEGVRLEDGTTTRIALEDLSGNGRRQRDLKNAMTKAASKFGKVLGNTFRRAIIKERSLRIVFKSTVVTSLQWSVLQL
jgi:hypothetical protein